MSKQQESVRYDVNQVGAEHVPGNDKESRESDAAKRSASVARKSAEGNDPSLTTGKTIIRSSGAQAGSNNDPRRAPSPGYAPDEPTPSSKKPRAPTEGNPQEPQNVPARKPGRGNG